MGPQGFIKNLRDFSPSRVSILEALGGIMASEVKMNEENTMDESTKTFTTTDATDEHAGIPRMSAEEQAEFKGMLDGICKDTDFWGKHGLKGRSGYVVGKWKGKDIPFHMSAPYDSDGKVFVDVKKVDPETKDELETWDRVDPEDANGIEVIKCSYKGCQNPAVRLDHLHPYHDERTNCEEHIDWFFKKP